MGVALGRMPLAAGQPGSPACPCMPAQGRPLPVATAVVLIPWIAILSLRARESRASQSHDQCWVGVNVVVHAPVPFLGGGIARLAGAVQLLTPESCGGGAGSAALFAMTSLAVDFTGGRLVGTGMIDDGATPPRTIYPYPQQ